MTIEIITADWQASPHVHALTTLRAGGISRSPYDSLNLAAHVGDNIQAVKENRMRLRAECNLPSEPVWLNQAHSTNIVRAEEYRSGQQADGSCTTNHGVVCAVLTADCLPLFLCSKDGSQVGIFHIGWRGLVKGMARAAVESFAGHGEVLAWLGPAIGPSAFEVGPEVKAAVEKALQPSAGCFQRVREGKWLANLYLLVAHDLQRRSVSCSYDPALCTVNDPARFYSYRRSPHCGRMASIIWMEH